MIHHRADEDVQPLFEIGFGKRPREELYDLRVDPHYMNNVATNPDYEQIRKDLANELMGILRENDDPRLVESPCRFEQTPYAGPLEGDERQEEIERLTNLGLSALIPNVTGE